jgi:hypothetical protein
LCMRMCMCVCRNNTKTYRASSDLVGLAVVVLVVRRVSIAIHGHDIGEDGSRTVVLVGIEEDAESLKLVSVTENRARLCTLLGEPHGEAIAVEVALSVDLEVDNDLLA